MIVTHRQEVMVEMSKKQWKAVRYLITVALSNRKSVADIAAYPHIEFYDLESLVETEKEEYR